VGYLRIVVSIPHRYCKNQPMKEMGADLCAFQFLIGTVKTIKRQPELPGNNKVSIPHRYCKN